jgi:hypothetical protein
MEKLLTVKEVAERLQIAPGGNGWLARGGYEHEHNVCGRQSRRHG